MVGGKGQDARLIGAYDLSRWWSPARVKRADASTSFITKLRHMIDIVDRKTTPAVSRRQLEQASDVYTNAVQGLSRSVGRPLGREDGAFI